MSDTDPSLSERVRSPFFAALICALAVLIGLAIYRGLTTQDIRWLSDVYAAAWYIAILIVMFCIGISLGSKFLKRLARNIMDVDGQI